MLRHRGISQGSEESNIIIMLETSTRTILRQGVLGEHLVTFQLPSRHRRPIGGSRPPYTSVSSNKPPFATLFAGNSGKGIFDPDPKP